MRTERSSWSRALRPLVGVGVSSLFFAMTLSRVDLFHVGQVWERASITLIGLAAIVSLCEVAVRALRWAALLRPLTTARFGPALAYISIGHLANAVLPVRLGDVARVLLAGARFRTSRISVLGTIAVERVADASLLALAAGGGILIGYSNLLPVIGVLGFVAVIGVLVVVAATMVHGRDAVSATRVNALIRDHAGRFAAGAAALRTPASAAGIVGLTLVSFSLAVLIMQLAAVSVGLAPAFWQSAIVVAAVMLSTAIPAGPASIGTYEFVGVTVMAAMGFPAEPSLLSIIIVHVVATLVPATMGLAAMWRLGLRRSPIGHGQQTALPPYATARLASTEPEAMDISVVVPAHNSGELIERTAKALGRRLAGARAEIIIVENGSTDDTWIRSARVAAAWRVPGIDMINLKSAKGMGNALRTGIMASRGASILLTADDLPFGFDDLDQFDQLVARGDRPLILIGSKGHPASLVDRGVARDALTRVFSIFRSAVLGMKTRDPQGTLIVNGPFGRMLAHHVTEQGFLFTTEFVHLSERLGLHPVEVPVRLDDAHRDHPSRIAVRDMLSMAIGLFAIRARHRGKWADATGRVVARTSR